MAEHQTVIELSHVTKRYGEHFAVNDVSFSIRKGEILGFLGRNGAGKTTTMNIITGYISSTAGRVTLEGVDILEDPRGCKRRIGYLPEHPPLYLDMTVQEYLSFVCDIKEVNARSKKAHLQDVCELVKITDHFRRPIKNLSKGYRQRVGLAQALVGNPDVIIMDEPTVGLDPRQIIEIRRLIKDLGQDHTVILSSHILTEVADVCDRAVIINKGVIVAEDTLDNLTRSQSELSRLTLRVAGPEKAVHKALAGVFGVKQVDDMGSKEEGTFDFILESDRDADVRRGIFSALAGQGYPIMMLRPMDMTLEDIFLQLTQEKEAV